MPHEKSKSKHDPENDRASEKPSPGQVGMTVGISDESETRLQRATIQWAQGDWKRLADIKPSSLEPYPARAKLALLAAAGHLQSGNTVEAEELLAFAGMWGCGKKQLGRILLSGACNSLARAVALAGHPDNGLVCFERSLSIGLPDHDTGPLAETRRQSQLTDLGLLEGTAGRLQNLQALAALSDHLAENRIPLPANDPIHGPALSYYQKFSEKCAEPEVPPFLLIDSKSLPRSGLHYLKSTFSKLLGNRFSFCEWYHEVGCCKKHPCSLLGYAQHAENSGEFRLRLKKSHDFKLTDPAVPTSPVLQRLILVRDPLYILTSWFELDQLTRIRNVVLEKGIDIRKIWLLHETEILMAAYDILESEFTPPSSDECKKWLLEKSDYIIRFSNKWVKPSLHDPDQWAHVVGYHELNQFIVDVMAPFRAKLSGDSLRQLDDFISRNDSNFRMRSDPYSLHAAKVESFVRENSNLFEECVKHIHLQTDNLLAV